MRLEAKPVIRGTRPTGKQEGRAEVHERKPMWQRLVKTVVQNAYPEKSS